MARARATKIYRTACAWEAVAAGIKPNQKQFPDEPVGIHLEFVPPSRRTYDHGNLVAWMKAGLDGLADAMGIDDRHFRLTHSVADRVGGMVLVTISRATQAGEAHILSIGGDMPSAPQAGLRP